MKNFSVLQKEKKLKKKEDKAARKALKDEQLLKKKNETPFRSQFARRLSIAGDEMSHRNEGEEMFVPNDCKVSQVNSEQSGDDSDSDENTGRTSPVAEAFRDRKRDRDSPQETTRNTRKKSSNQD